MLFRIDDYPTGIKPVIPNRFAEFDKVLSEFEKRKLKYLLGVVHIIILILVLVIKYIVIVILVHCIILKNVLILLLHIY